MPRLSRKTLDHKDYIMPTTKKSKLAEAQQLLETVELKPTSVASKQPASISIPSFDPASYLAGDLLSDSSNLPRMASKDADNLINAIGEKRQSLRVIGENLRLNADAFKVGSLAEKMNQARLIYQADGIDSQSKMVGLELANSRLEIAGSKLNQSNEKLAHQNIELEGLRRETPLREAYWTAKLALIESRIMQVENAKFSLDAKIGLIESGEE